jgi:hypothetical protein
VASYENAVYLWQRAERRLGTVSPERRPLLDRIVSELVTELRRRLGGRFTAQELADLYAKGTSWCMQTAMVAAPDDPWAWDSSLVADAAFGRYLREASDYAGGRLALSEA